mgnify:CR=1 FL=1
MLTRATITFWLSRLHRGLALVPFAWLLAMTVLVCGVAWHLGHLPGCEDRTPEALEWLELIALLLFFASVYAVYAWSVCTAALLALAPHELRRNSVSIGLCLGSSMVFLAVSWLPNQQLLCWLLD